MIAFKAFNPGLRCRDYQFQMGLNTTEEANCRQNGFHCAEDPLDCLTYYANINQSEYYLVNAGGDINEDDHDSKIACTELTILEKLTMRKFLLYALAYMTDHPKRGWNGHVQHDKAEAGRDRYAIVRGKDPIAKGSKGSILAFAREDESGNVVQVALAEVDGTRLRPDVWYDVDLRERSTV